MFEWGNGYETQALINSLQIRCIYHLLSVNFAAWKYKIRGGFEGSLVLQIKREALAKEICLLADFGEARVLQFIDFLIYGNNCSTPDPALQPLIPTKSGVLLLPCLHIITNNIQRNSLTLLARVKRSYFDRQSNIFELEMVNDLAKQTHQWEHKKINKVIRHAGQSEEIDLLILDENSGFVLALELRWMLQPGDPREILNRVEACEQKVKQMDRKLKFLRENARTIIPKTFDILNQNCDWKIQGAVVLQGFGGQLSENPEIPIITMSALKVGLAAFNDLENLHDWIKSLKWLPEPNKHFTLVNDKIETPHGELYRPSFTLNSGVSEYVNHLKSTVLQ